MRILIAGESGNNCLETSYQHAFRQLGHEAEIFDTQQAVLKHARFGAIGKKLHRFFAVEAWLRKANKDLVNFAVSYQPDVLVAFTNAEILPGTIAYLKSRMPLKTVWYWADPLPNLNRYIHASLPLADLAAVYSRNTCAVFLELGARKAIWVPFAGDKEAHYEPVVPKENYEHDISFVGSWRPEREQCLSAIHRRMPNLRLAIYGPYWKRITDKSLKPFIQATPLYGKAFTGIVQRSFLNLNVADDNNYPAVNMRFFEIPVAGGLQLCSYSPEVTDVFTDREHVLYFKDEEELEQQIGYALAHKKEMDELRSTVQQLVLQQHLYTSRAQAILDNL